MRGCRYAPLSVCTTTLARGEVVRPPSVRCVRQAADPIRGVVDVTTCVAESDEHGCPTHAFQHLCFRRQEPREEPPLQGLRHRKSPSITVKRGGCAAAQSGRLLHARIPSPQRPETRVVRGGDLGARDEAMRANERATRERASEGVLRVDETVCRSAQARPRGPANVLRPSGWRHMRPAQLGQRAAGRWRAWGRGPLFALSERTNTPCQRAPPPQYGQLAQCELSGQ